PMTAPAPQAGWTPARQPTNIPKLPIASHQRFATMRELDQRLFHMEHVMNALVARHDEGQSTILQPEDPQKAGKELMAVLWAECSGIREWFKLTLERQYADMPQPAAAHPQVPVPVSAPPSFPVVNNTTPQDALQQLKLMTSRDRHSILS